MRVTSAEETLSPRNSMSTCQPPMVPGSTPTGRTTEFCRSPIQRVITDLWATDKLILGGIPSPKINCWKKDQLIDPMHPDPPPTCHQTVARFCEHHYFSLLIQGIMPEVQQTRYIQGREYSRAKFCGRVVPNMSNGVPHLGLPYISTIGSPSGMYGRADHGNQVKVL